MKGEKRKKRKNRFLQRKATFIFFFQPCLLFVTDHSSPTATTHRHNLVVSAA